MKSIECPSCGHHGLVQRSPDVFQCVSCRFKQDFSSSENTFSLFGYLLVVAIATWLIYSDSSPVKSSETSLETGANPSAIYSHYPP